jgi:hypothetical protein
MSLQQPPKMTDIPKKVRKGEGEMTDNNEVATEEPSKISYLVKRNKRYIVHNLDDAVDLLTAARQLCKEKRDVEARIILKDITKYHYKPAVQVNLALGMECGDLTLGDAIVQYVRFIIPANALGILESDDYLFIKRLFTYAINHGSYRVIPAENLPEDLQKMSFINLMKLIYLNRHNLQVHSELLSALYNAVLKDIDGKKESDE